jgi:hypothetical protein
MLEEPTGDPEAQRFGFSRQFVPICVAFVANLSVAGNPDTAWDGAFQPYNV